MKKFLIIAILSLSAYAGELRAQPSIEHILNGVEKNNASLAAKRKLTDVQTIEAKVGNSLENPDVEYVHSWGSPSELGKTGELTVTQPFDFPTAYANRNKLAKIRAEQYGHEYAAYRQQILLEARTLCIEIAAMRQKRGYLHRAMDNAERIKDIIMRRSEAGDATVLDENKAKVELISAKNAFSMNEVELSNAVSRLENLNGGITVDTAAISTQAPLPLRPIEQMAALYEEASPELLALVSDDTAARQDVKVSRSRSLPKLALGYKYEFAEGERFNGVVMGMSIPMFGNRNNVKRARAQAAFAEAELERARTDMHSGLRQLYAQAALLESSMEEYRSIITDSDPEQSLFKALETGHTSLSDYYDQLNPVYDSYITLVETEMNLALVCARINMIDL